MCNEAWELQGAFASKLKMKGKQSRRKQGLKGNSTPKNQNQKSSFNKPTSQKQNASRHTRSKRYHCGKPGYLAISCRKKKFDMVKSKKHRDHISEYRNHFNKG